jgi:polysaccharide pyruvyl transferase WcaK-like protein
MSAERSITAVGISGSYGGLNVGDEAVLTVAIDQLRRALPEARIVVFSRNPEHTFENTCPASNALMWLRTARA